MYCNLEAELKRKQITREQLADLLGINVATVSRKLNLPNRLKLCEALEIQEKLFPDMDMRELFEFQDPQPGARG